MKTVTAELEDVSGKADAKGRRLVTAERKAELLPKYEASGLTQKVFAKQEGVKYCTFLSWLGKKRRKSVPTRPPFLEVGLPVSKMTGCLELVLANDVVVRGLSMEQLLELLGKVPRC